MSSSDKKEAVLLTAMSLNFGGAETHVINLAKNLSARGYRVMVASQGGILQGELAAAGISHLRVSLHSRSPFSIWSSVRQLHRILLTGDVGLIHAHARIPAWVSEQARSGRDIPLVTTFHGVYASGWPWRAVTRTGDATIAVSPEVEAYLTRAFGTPRNRITVIPNGVDTDAFSPDVSGDSVRSEFFIETGPVVVHVSRLAGPSADTALALIPAARQLLGDFPDLNLIIVGSGNRQATVAAKALEVNRSAGRRFIHVTGGRKDVAAIFATADLVVGSGRTALEGMSSGRPVIIAGQHGVGSVVTPENFEELRKVNFTPRYAPEPLTPWKLAATIGSVLKDGELAARLGRFGREQVLAGFSIKHMVDQVERVYQRVKAGGLA